MTHRFLTLGIVAAAALMTMASSSFSAEPAPGPLQFAPHEAIGAQSIEHRGQRPHPMMLHALAVSQRLAVAEIYLGISSAQLDVWRSYTNAWLAFVVADRPPSPPPSASPEAGSVPSAEDADDRLLSEDLANKAIAIAEAAKALKAAVGNLRQTLAPEQIQRLDEIERALQPHDPPALSAIQ